jgi:outer membrane receptor protein involved in Fe transport
MSLTVFQAGCYATAAIGTLIQAAPARAAQDQEILLALPAQPLAKSLQQIAEQSGVSIIAPGEMVEGRKAPALQGRYAAGEAVALLLEGSGLEARAVDGALVVGRMSDRDAPPEPEARGPDIIVTGTNLRGGQPSSPLIIISKRDIEDSGANSVEQLMRKLPQNAQGGVNRENFRSPGAGADPTEHGAGLNLRGLGQRATLVLVDGRRLAPSNAGSFVDMSLIPLSSVERIEILTDGASAIYGSDAVGGVVNFILKDKQEGIEASGLIGSATRGDGDVLQAALSGGTSWGSGSALLSYEYRSEDEIAARDRPFTINLAPDTTILPAEKRHSVFTRIAQELATGLHADLTGSFARRRTDRSYFFTGSPVPVDLEAKASMLSLGARLRYRLPSEWELAISGGYSRTKTHQLQDEVGGQGLVNFRETRNSLADAGFTLNGPLAYLPAGAIKVAIGAEGRREGFDDLFKTNFSTAPIKASRNVVAAFAEIQVPIFSAANRTAGLERLVLTAAGRYERYNDFGSAFNPKLGLLWSPLPGLSLRTSYDTSFRAPLLYETSGAYSAIYLPAALVFVDPDGVSGVALALGGSNPQIGPERSRSWTAGVEFEPPSTPGLKLALNYYSIHFKDRIALPSQTITVVGDPAFDSIVTHDPDDGLVQDLIDGAQVAFDISGPNFTNGHATPADVIAIVDGRINNTAKTLTQGLDASVDYRFGWKGNDFRLGANLNYIFSFNDQLRPTSAALSAVDTPFRPLDLRFRAHAGWTRARWSANFFLNYADGYRDNRGNRSQSVDSFTTVDGTVAYRFGEGSGPWLRGLRLAVNGENLLDQDPPRLLPDPGSTAGLGYDPVNASGRGRFISLQLSKSW